VLCAECRGDKSRSRSKRGMERFGGHASRRRGRLQIRDTGNVIVAIEEFDVQLESSTVH
jgi:hypothetical protein